MNSYQIPTLRDVYVARKIMSRYIVRTPLIYARKISKLINADVYLKLENLQVTRAFKVRGGVYYANAMKDQAIRRGLITASTGNHAQSIAYAGSLIGARTIIVMPSTAPKNKIEAVRDLGAEVLIHGRIFEEAREMAEKLAEEKNMLYIHPVNEPLLYPGVATMHIEVIEDLPDVDVIINPIGGGSGASGAVIVAKSINPSIKVIGVQAEGAQSFYLSWKRGELVATGRADTIAEGLATARAYEYPFQILKDRIDDIVLVSDPEIIEAVRILLELEGVVAEPSGAASLAAALKIKDKLAGKKIVAMITGGNIDPERIREITCYLSKNK